MRIHVTFPLFGECLEILRAEGRDVDVRATDAPHTPESLARAVEGCDGLLCTLFDRLDEAFFDRFAPPRGRLRFVAQFGVGYDNIDARAAAARGVLATNTPGVLTDATAEMAVALMSAAARRVGEGERVVRAGAWPGWRPDQLLGRTLVGGTLGIVGAGRIGRRVAELLRGFEMRILYWNRTRRPDFEAESGARFAELDELLAAADFVSLHVALTPETRHLIDARRLALMKPDAVLANTARGAVVDEAALVEALRAGRLGAAGLDVYEAEPRLAPGLAELENVVLAPHLGSATRRARLAMGTMAAKNLVAMLEGREPPNRIA